MQQYHPPNIIHIVLEQILQAMDEGITIIDLVHQLPNFLTKVVTSLMSENTKQLTMQAAIIQKTGMREDSLVNVPRINKDSLMPKDVSQQHTEQQQQQSQNLRKSTASNNIKKSNLGKSSLFLSAKLKSLSLSDKKSITTTRDKNQTKCEILKAQIPEQNQDAEFNRLRGRTEARLQFLQEQNRMRLQRQKSFKEKQKQMNQILQDNANANFTYHYEGESVKSTIDEDKIKNYILRVGIGATNKKLKDSCLAGPLQSKIQINKNKRDKQRQQDIKPMEIPVFPASFMDFSQEPREYKLSDYKKHFGRRYSRLDHLSHTIDLNSSSQKEDKDEGFTQRKHLRDSSSVLGQSKNTIDTKLLSRKLALPRLHGKYKVLDRYQQF